MIIFYGYHRKISQESSIFLMKGKDFEVIDALTWHHFFSTRNFPIVIQQKLLEWVWHNTNSSKKRFLLIGSHIDLWRQFCFFTFFIIIQREDYNTFNTLIDQLRTTVKSEKTPFTIRIISMHSLPNALLIAYALYELNRSTNILS